MLKRIGPFCLQGYFFSRVLMGCANLADLTEDLAKLRNRLDSGGLLGALPQNIASMHISDVSHGDLKWSDILVDMENNELWFVDLDSAELHGQSPSTKAEARDLARFLRPAQ